MWRHESCAYGHILKKLEQVVEITHSISACMKVLLGLIAHQG